MDEQRAEFEAWASHFFTRGELDRHGINGARPDEYRVLHIERMWGAWQAATQRQHERIAYVEKIADDAIELGNQQAIRIAKMERDLQFVERWANHHGAKPHTTAKEALSVIQHYPPITRITRGYADGVFPDTFDPYARIAELEAQVQALSMDAGRYRWLRDTPWLDTSIQSVIALQQNAKWDAAIDAARAAGKGEA